MNCTVFVEGQSEMLFVADLLGKYSRYDGSLCGFICLNLRNNNIENVSFPHQGSRTSQHYYQIINTNNDELVNSNIKKNFNNLKARNFDKIIGLRDVYGENYRKLNRQYHSVNWDIIDKMRLIQNKEFVSEGKDIHLHFAIMEFEAWLLALLDSYCNHEDINLSALYQESGIVEVPNKEEIYHPTPVLQSLLQKVGKNYRKRESDVLSMLAVLEVEDYENLRVAEICKSFTSFSTDLLEPFLPPF